MHRLAIFGISGRMGAALLHELATSREFVLGGALVSPASAWLDRSLKPAGNGDVGAAVSVTGDPARAVRGTEVAIDVSTAHAVADHAAACAHAGVPLFVAATGFDAETRDMLRRASEQIAIVVAPNTSLGVSMLAKLVALAARALGDSFDADIAETHHRHKIDAPSGTALKLGQAVAEGRGVNLNERRYEALSSTAAKPRPKGSIGFTVTRAGSIVGEHTVTFVGEGEELTLTHRATDRACFARGALSGARWLIGRSPGLYTMNDVLGI